MPPRIRHPENGEVQAWRTTQERIHDVLGWISYQRGDHASALSHLQIARSFDENPQVLYHSGRLLADQGNSWEGLSLLIQAVVRAPDSQKPSYRQEADKLLRQIEAGGIDSLVQSAVKVISPRRLRDLRANYTPESAELSLRTPSGKLVRLEDLRGQVVILHSWSVGSSPCIAGMPFLAELRRREEGGALRILAINTDGDTQDVSRFLSEEHLPALEIPFDKDSYGRYKLKGVPTRVFTDRNGNIRFRLVGFAGSMTEKDIELITRALLAAVP